MPGLLGRGFDVSIDGKRSLMIKMPPPTGDADTPQRFVVVLNWFDELKRLTANK